jgi:hypothetical protein
MLVMSTRENLKNQKIRGVSGNGKILVMNNRILIVMIYTLVKIREKNNYFKTQQKKMRFSITVTGFFL